ncbi:MAG: TonB-dependent receptor [Flavobacterium sp.]|nr:TonB-dependent receptor [Flavobacterium sp.]
MKKIFLLFLMIFAVAINAQTNNLKISGTVVDSKGLSIPGVTITSADTSTTTNMDGGYTIAVKNSKSVIRYTYIGFTAQIIVVGTKKVINVTLVESLDTLDEVVVIGYGTQKRSSVTGSVAKYQNEKLSELAVSRVDQALQGKIAGVQVINTSSEAGADPKINIRGAVSINASNNPLIIVDGQQNQDGLGSLNMADVQSVEVLKDAASAAIYGSRGANGVIIVTTKSGKTDKVRFNFKYQTGVKTAYETYPMMTSSEYVKLLYAERELKKLDPTVNQLTNTIPSSTNNNAQWLIEQEFFGGQGTDYQEEALRTGTYKTVGFNASGGSKTTKYYVSLGYNGDEGMQIHSNFEKYNFLTKLNVELSKRVKLDINLNPQYSIREAPSENFTNFIRYPSFLPVYHTAQSAAFVNQNPQYASVKAGDASHPRHFSNLTYPSMGMTGVLPDGTIMKPANANPFASAQNNPVTSVLNQSVTQNDYRLQGALNLTVNILPGLDFKTMGSTFMKYTDGLNWSNTNATGDGISNKGIYTKNSYVDLLWENTLTYKKEIGDHSFDAVVLYSAEKARTKNEQITGLTYPSDDVRNLSSALTIDKATTTGSNFKNGLLSYMGRLNYSFKDKYVLSMSMRADGSSYFGPGNKWGYFPAGSVGWKLHKESFLEDVSWLSKLLLRASYGASGNNRIDYFLYQDTFVSTSYPLGSGVGSPVGGLSPNPNIQSNSDITWETTYQTNLGLDLSLFKNRANLNIDVYQSKTDKLLLYQPSMAFTGVTQAIVNNGSMKNKGIEIELSTTNIANKNFKWTTQANFSHTENEIIELGSEPFINSPGERSEVYQAYPGNPLIQYYGYKTDGVWLSQAQIDEAKAGGLTSNLSNLFLPGGLKLVDVNGDKKIDTDDRTVIGNPYPDFIWGMTNLFSYRAFDLSFSLQGSQGGELINGDANYNETKRYNTNYNENRWVSAMFPGDGKTPYDTTGFNWMLTDYVVEDASYVALRDVTVGFTMPSEYVSKFHLNGMRLYFSGSNLFYYSPKGYRGVNSEGRSTSGSFYGNTLIDGYQRGSFPIAKTVVFGLDINF